MLLAKLISKKRNYFSIGKDYTRALSTIVHSDILFSALCNNYRLLYGKDQLEEFLGVLTQDSDINAPEFNITSCFHYIDIFKEGTYVDSIYFLPRPMITFPFDEASEEFEENNPKIFKKVEFVSLGVMKKLQQNQSITFDQFHVLDERYLIDTGDLEKLGIRNYYQKRKKSHIKRQLEAIQERISVFNIVEEQKVRISRKTSDSDPYIWPKFIFQKSEYFTNDKGETDNYELYSGFYFLLNLDGMNKEQSAKVKAALRLIMDQGLGGKRSLGNGLVDDIEFIELKSSFEYQEVFTIKSNGGYMNLSLVYPTSEDLHHIPYFSLFERSGFIYSPRSKGKRIKDIKLLEEGSIFREQVLGTLVPVASEEFAENYHQVYKNGQGFYINIGKIKEDS